MLTRTTLAVHSNAPPGKAGIDMIMTAHLLRKVTTARNPELRDKDSIMHQTIRESCVGTTRFPTTPAVHSHVPSGSHDGAPAAKERLWLLVLLIVLILGKHEADEMVASARQGSSMCMIHGSTLEQERRRACSAMGFVRALDRDATGQEDLKRYERLKA